MHDDDFHDSFDTMTHLRGSLFVALFLAVASNAARAQRPDSTPPRIVRVSAPVEVQMINVGSEASPLPAVEVMLNGRGPYRFGIETGARFLVVSNEVATAAGLSRRSSDGEISEYRADSVSIGAAMLGDVTLSTLPRMPRGVDGLLGLPAFADLLLTIDYPGQRVRLERDTLPAADDKTVLGTTRASDFIAIPVRFGSRQVNTIIDTRSMTGFAIEPVLAEQLRWKTAPTVAGSAGGAGIPTTTISRGVFGESVGVGRYEFTSAPLTIHALPPEFPHEPRIGAGILKYFTFTLDQRTNRVRFERAASPTIDLGAPSSIATTNVNLDDYVGKYGERTITARDGKLFLQRPGGEPLEMVATAKDQFGLVRVAEARIEFTRDTSGRVISIAVLAPSGQWERANRAP